MSHKYRKPAEVPPTLWIAGYIVDCTSGKRGYRTRAEAKKSANNQFKMGRQKKRLSAYYCYEDTPCGYYHLGTLPSVVKQGKVTRDTLKTRSELIEEGTWRGKKKPEKYGR